MIGPAHYLFVSAVVFAIAVFGILINRRNVILLLMAVELMLLAVMINFVTFSATTQDISGQVFSMFILTVAAAETAIGLAIFVTYFRQRGTIASQAIDSLKN